MITPIQIKMARAALGWGVRELAKMAECAPSTILRFETGKGGMQTGTLSKIRETLENAGILFVEADERYGPGVRLRNKT